MDDENFEGPPAVWLIGTVVAGILSSLGLLIFLQYLSKKLPHPPHSTSNQQVIMDVTLNRDLAQSPSLKLT